MEAAFAFSLTLPAGQVRQDFLRDALAALAGAAPAAPSVPASGPAAPPIAPSAPEVAPEVVPPAEAPARPNKGINFASDDFRRMVRDGVFPNGVSLYIRTVSGIYEAKMSLNYLAGGALDGHIVSDPKPDFYGWEGGKWTSPSAFSKAQSAHITPRHPRPSDGANGWSVVRVGNQHGPTLDEIRGIWRENRALAVSRVAALMPSAA